ncbi:aspartate aminotransferase family protein [Paenibacillus sp. FJAT-26967]|uniref:pyridoxal phosphate-dependent decarboxylase family protein n=1 Tax=Paenibacillus sp. FJAT-26967 TaxID=1729690 RepID=UPI000837A94C|nr:aspartate aminotransferase family protein [Paenibacillus sp. FJAT-26967]
MMAADAGRAQNARNANSEESSAEGASAACVASAGSAAEAENRVNRKGAVSDINAVSSAEQTKVAEPINAEGSVSHGNQADAVNGEDPVSTGDSSAENSTMPIGIEGSRTEAFRSLFLNETAESQRSYRDMMTTAVEVIIRDFASSPQPYSGLSPEQLAGLVDKLTICPENGSDMFDVLGSVGETILRNSAVVTHPTCAAHLHCPPLASSLAAEALISATNQSMDSWDQSMAGTLLEQRMIRWLCGLAGYASQAEGRDCAASASAESLAHSAAGSALSRQERTSAQGSPNKRERQGSSPSTEPLPHEKTSGIRQLDSLSAAKPDGVFTSGGTQSNYMGLLLARDRFCMNRWHWNVRELGLHPAASRMRVLCSEAAHFTVKQSAAQLGLGEQAVVSIPVDSQHRMRLDLLEQQLTQLRDAGLLPFALVATAGTTDFGSIDPLPELAAVARRHDLWLHTDAAYGGALLLSDKHAGLLAGLDLADSIAVDFHKMFYQPISCGAFLLRDRHDFRFMRQLADYLNPAEDEEDGVPNLVTKSVQTTRRFDALKLYISMQHIGRLAFGEMIDYTLELARGTAALIRQEPAFEMMNEPVMNAIVFRYVPASCPAGRSPEEWSDELNVRIRSTLLSEGTAVLARTKANGRLWLKFTLLNPGTELRHTKQILQRAQEIGRAVEAVG